MTQTSRITTLLEVSEARFRVPEARFRSQRPESCLRGQSQGLRGQDSRLRGQDSRFGAQIRGSEPRYQSRSLDTGSPEQEPRYRVTRARNPGTGSPEPGIQVQGHHGIPRLVHHGIPGVHHPGYTCRTCRTAMARGVPGALELTVSRNES